MVSKYRPLQLEEVRKFLLRSLTDPSLTKEHVRLYVMDDFVIMDNQMRYQDGYCHCGSNGLRKKDFVHSR